MKILNVKPYLFVFLFIALSNKNFSQTIDLNKPVGTTGSQSGVSPTGGVSYIIPIEALKGSNNMSPNVNLTYNSQSGEGIAGFGWNLSNYSVISRQGKRQYFNGQNTPVSFQNTLDAFLLDGQRLFPLTGTNGNNGVIYGTENESFSKIESFGGSGSSGPDWFKVTTRDGIILEYGADAGSRVWNDGSTSIMYWLLRRVIDKAGNYQLYSYQINHSNRYFALTEIAYTGNTNINQLPYNKIEFTYNFLPNWQNRKAFDGGSKIVSPYLLNKINVKNVDDIYYC